MASGGLHFDIVPLSRCTAEHCLSHSHANSMEMRIMVYNNTLTATKKDKAYKVIRKRDGDGCFYCKLEGTDPRFIEELSGHEMNFDHLNDNEEDQRVENLVLAHAMCNQKKKNNYDWKIKALEKLEWNVKWHSASLSESEGERKQHTTTSELKEPDVNLIINKLVKAELESKIPKDSKNEILYSKVLRGVHFLTIQQTGGRGSEQAVRRSLDAYCSEYADWEDYTDGTGKRMIRRRHK